MVNRLLIGLLLLAAALACAQQPPTLREPVDKAANVAIPVTLRWDGNPAGQNECDVARDENFTDSALLDKQGAGTSRALSHLLPGVTYYWRARAAGGNWSAARSFTTSEAVPPAARAGRIVAALAPQSGTSQIFIMNADGSNSMRLTNLFYPQHPTLSPDGRLIAFTVTREGDCNGTGGLYLMRADGSGCHKLDLPAGRVWLPAFAPAGDVLYFAFGENLGADWHLCRMNVDGTGFKRLTIPASMQAEPALSEDGALVALLQRGGVLYALADGSKRAQLTAQYQQGSPCFSRDGKSLLSSAFTDARMKLMQVFTDGSGDACLVTRDGIFSPCDSPDGSIILYADRNGLRRITADGADAALPAAPAGNYLHLRWQAAAGRWTPDPPAMNSPADGAANVPLPATLRWTPIPGCTGYGIQVATTPDFQQPVVELKRTFGAEASLDRLEPHAKYYWRIRALFREEQGAWSPARAFTAGESALAKFGQLHGTLTFDGGGPIAKARVTVTIGGATSAFVTKDDGTFAGILPAGDGIASAEGATAPVTVKPGQATKVALVRKPTAGVVITATLPDGTPFKGGLTGAARHRAVVDGEPTYDVRMPMEPRVVGTGVYWFPEVRQEDTDFAVNINLQGSFFHGIVVHRWLFPKQEAIRKLPLVVPAPVHVLLTLTDEAGKPLPNTHVDGRLARWFRDSFNFWPEMERESFYCDDELRGDQRELLTDDQGRLDLRNMVPQTYYLTVTTADAESARVTLQVKEDGTYAPQTLTLKSGRAVTQTLYQPDGKPAAHAAAIASYLQGGKIAMQQAVADERGIVTWRNLPRRRVIVSGPGVAAGVIPPDGADFPRPLPAPAPGPAVKYQMELRVSGTTPVTFGMVIKTPDDCQSIHWFEKLNTVVTGSSMPETWTFRTGVPFTYFWGANFAPAQVRLLRAYLPYLDEGIEQIALPLPELPCTAYTGVTVQGKVVTKTSAPAAGAKLRIAPAPTNLLYEALTVGKVDWMLAIPVDKDGAFTTSLLPTGDYLVTANGKTLATLTVTPENTPRGVTITLP